MSSTETTNRRFEILLKLGAGKCSFQELMAEFDVSDRTLRRDLEALSARFPIVFGSHENAYQYHLEDWYRFPGIAFTPDELAALWVGKEHALKALEQLPFFDSFAAALERVERFQKGQSWRKAQQLPQVYQTDFPTPQIQASFHELLLQATLEHQRLELLYFSANRGEESWIKVEPFFLKLTVRGLHLIVYHLEKQKFVYLNANRIRQAHALEETFSPEERRFDLEQFTKETFDGMRSTPVQKVRLLIKGKTAHWAKELFFHPTQTICEVEDGVEIAFESGGEAAIVRRILYIGPDCHVLEPQSLKQQVLEAVSAFLQQPM
ncbi:MAG TPA: hypothetical protein DCE42_07775 [Myxococcales bacterium]|nr:hypothetical protein [Deltaproteobacteria bacterium]HAA54641.1 hypothetical protein [Myxococcales bacterium]